MTSINIGYPKLWEKSSNDWECLVGNIFTPRASHEESGLLKAHLIGIFERELAQVVESRG